MNKNEEKPAGLFEVTNPKTEIFHGYLFDKESFINEKLYISDHMKKHRNPDQSNELGCYLGGLMYGLERFEKKIEIPLFDIRTAYYIKKKIGYGKVKKLTNSNQVVYLLEHNLGIKKLNSLLLDKENEDILLNNHWLAGFADRNGSFNLELQLSDMQIGICRLEWLIKHKNPDQLRKIKQKIGGVITEPEIPGSGDYCFNSTEFKTAYKVIKYLDSYNLINTKKYRQYFQWRKAYRIIQRREHLTYKGIKKLEKLQKNLRD